MLKFISKNIYILFPLLYIILLSVLVGDFYYHDGSFPLSGTSMDIKNKFLYMWSDQFLGTDNLLEKIRSGFRFIVNQLGLYSPGYFFFLLFSIGYFSSYKFTGLFTQRIFIRVGVSLFFICNPFVVNHLGHFLILQGYFITPLILFFYWQYIRNKDYISFSLLGFILCTFLLGQPHNYSNLIVTLFLFNIFLLCIEKNKYLFTFKKNIFALLLTIISYSFVVFPGIALRGNSALVGSKKHFSENVVNGHYSKNDSLIDVFQISNLDKLGIKLFDSPIITSFISFVGIIIGLLIAWIMILFFLQKKTSQNSENLKIGLGLYIIISIFLVLIHTYSNNFFINTVYTAMPHITVATNYVIPVFIFGLVGIFCLVRNTKITIALIILVQIICLSFFTFSDFFKIKNLNPVNKYNEDSIVLKSDNRLGYEYIAPLKSRQLLEGFNEDVSILIFAFDSFSFKSMSIEQMLPETITKLRETFEEGDYDSLVNNYPFKTFVEINDSELVRILESRELIILKDQYTYFSSYDNPNFQGIFRSNNLFDSPNSKIEIIRQNPTKYIIRIKKLSDRINLSFLQSYHSGWKLKLKGMSDEPCNINKYYSTLQQNIIECNGYNRFLKSDYINSMFSKGLLIKSERDISTFGNKFNISKDDILNYPVNNANSKDYIINNDGTIDVEFSLEFGPQKHFIVGIFISVISLIIFLLCLFFKRRIKITHE